MTRRGALRRTRHYVNEGKWAIVDQALSSGSNFLLAIIVVGSVSAAEFGAFSIAVLVYVLALGVNRALTTEPLAIRYGRATEPIMAQARRCLGLGLAFGIVVGGACLVAAVITDGTVRSVLLVTGLSFPLLMVQDAGRVTFFALGRPRRAAANDAVWAVLEVPLVAAVMLQPHPQTWHYVAAWMIPGVLAGVFALMQLRISASLRDAVSWFVDTRKLAIPLVWNFGLTTAPGYLLFAMMPIVATLYELGLARSAFIAFGFFGVIFQSAWLMLLPAASRKSRESLGRLAFWSSTGLGALALIWSLIVVLVVPDELGVILLGDSWNETEAVRLIFTVALVAQAIGVGPLVALRALEAPKVLVYVRLATAPLMLAVGTVLAARHGAEGLAAGIAIGDLCATGLSWAVFMRMRSAGPAPSSRALEDGWSHSRSTATRSRDVPQETPC